MIIDKIENKSSYFNLIKGLDKADFFVQNILKDELPPGKYEIIGKDIFAIVQNYSTTSKEGKLLEAHKKYIDLQLILSGEEFIGWAPLSELTQEREEYSKGGDIAFYTGECKMNIPLKTLYFAIFFPNDAHMPCIAISEPTNVKKVVIKIVLN